MYETDENFIHSLDDDQKSADQFEINGQQYILYKHNAENTHASSTSTDSQTHICHLNPQKLKQLQEDENITKLIAKCKSSKNNETPYHLDKYGIIYTKIRDGPNIFHAIMVPKPCSPIFYMSATMH